jgi:hypothetical protein
MTTATTTKTTKPTKTVEPAETTAHEATRREHGTRKDWQDQYFTLVKRVETPLLETTARVVARLVELLPERPAFLAQLPRAHDLRAAVDTGVTFRKRVVEEQTLFARRMLKTLEPVIEKVDTVQTPETPGRYAKPSMNAARSPETSRDDQHRAA